jgi:excisionase family DNA binding protein
MNKTPKPTTQPDLFLCREEVAKTLHVSEDTVSSYIREGKLNAVRLGRRLLIPAAAITSLASK